MPLNSEAFTYYDSDGEYQTIQVGSDDPAAGPFVVRLSRKGIIPCNVLIFAADSADAIARVLAAIDMVCWQNWKHRKRFSGRRWERKYHAGRLFRIRKDIKAGKLKATAEPFGKRSISKVQWASNDGVCY